MPRVARLASGLALAAAAVATAVLPATGSTAAPAPLSVRSTPCTRTSDQPGNSSAAYELQNQGLERRYIVHLPRGYERRADWPLIVAFHGRGSTGPEVEGYSGLSRLPAVVVYPDGAIGTGDGARRAWQGAPYEPKGVDDVAFTTALLDELQESLCVDPRRTYATGKSNGAGFVGLLACRLPDRIAAFAPVSGAFYPQAREGCDGARPVPMLTVHGTADTTIPYAGDADRDLPSIRSYTQEWADRAGCASAPRVVRTARDVTTYRWRNCTAGADVQHVAVLGGGHVWPGADVYSGGGHVTHSIEGYRVVWKFFERHELPKGAAR